ncbi:MAG: respiratory nitrate reductase subunit beta [Elusimicrobia bacterium]|nr:MAG: respiratory nitrate reductase subunit beta [Elusimicrobiota bacterium]
MPQIAMVIDLNKCIGCQTCTAACKSLWTDEPGQKQMFWNNVETRPGLGYPRDWESSGGGWAGGRGGGTLKPGTLPPAAAYGFDGEPNHDEAYSGRADRLRVYEKRPEWGANWDEDSSSGTYPNNFHFYLPRLCNHCTHPACMHACPVRAIYKREQDGIVLIDQDRCQGRRECVKACPYKKIYFNTTAGRSQKCIFCFPRVESGVPPACARQCPGRLRFVGMLDDASGPIHRLVEHYKVALPLHPEYGTGPNVFYVPPVLPPTFGPDGRLADDPRIPTAYLRSLFGAGVDDALAKIRAEMQRRQRGEPSELMDLLIARDWKTLFHIPEPHRA